MLMKNSFIESAIVPGMIAWLAIVCSAQAELLPTTGTFKGIYHQDRFGGRHFLFFNIPEELHSAFDRYNGKYIEADVLKGEQPINPGYVNIKSIGTITELPQPGIKLTASVTPVSPLADTPCQVIVQARNIGAKRVEFGPGVKILFRSPPVSTGTPAVWSYSPTSTWHLRNLVKSIPWRRHHILGHPTDHVSKIELAPGESMTWALSMDQGVPEGQYEIEAGLEIEDNDERITVAAWAVLDVGTAAAEENLKRTTLNLAHSPFETGSEWVSVQLHLTNEKGSKPRKIPQCLDHGKVPLWAGRLHGFTKERPFEGADPRSEPAYVELRRGRQDATVGLPRATGQNGSPRKSNKVTTEGVEVPLTFDYPIGHTKGPPEGVWRPTLITREGLKMTMTFRTESWFQPAPIKTLTCDILTDRGLETFLITDSYEDRLFSPLPPFGEVKNGVKCRFRTQKETYKQNEPIRLYWQVINVDQVPVMCRSKDGWQVRIDGKRVKSAYNADRLWGWATEQGPYRPDEYFIDLKDVTLTPGEHSVQLVCKGSGWRSYKNANGAEIPVFKGSLVSNLNHITILPEGK